MPTGSLILGVDLSPIKAIPKVITLQSDITSDKCRASIRSYFKSWKADTVLHDGAPNVGTAWVQDSFNQAELALQSLKLATEFLIEGGTFVTKVFRSKDYNSLLWVFNQLFTKVESTKPPSSRNVSAEIFVVCRGFKAPKRIDSRLLDPKSVFEELSDPTPNNEAKVFNPEVKKRKRDGYEEGNYTQFKETLVTEFIKTTDPIAMLGSLNRLSFEQPPNGDIALTALNGLIFTTDEIRNCCQDLRVLGRKEFRALLRWRLKVREKFGLTTAQTKKTLEEETVSVEPMDEELKIQAELQALTEKESALIKRERRKENEKKRREIIRMQLHMTAPMDIGLEQASHMNEACMFSLKPLDRSGLVNSIAKGKMAILSKKDDDNILNEPWNDEEIDENQEILDQELDRLYVEFQARKSEKDANFRAKKARKELDDGDWDGFSTDSVSSNDQRLDADSSEDDSSDDSLNQEPLLVDLQEQRNAPDGLSRRAAQFFSQDIFNDTVGLSQVELESKKNDDIKSKRASQVNIATIENGEIDKIHLDTEETSLSDLDGSEDSFEIVKESKAESKWEDEPSKDKKIGKFSFA